MRLIGRDGAVAGAMYALRLVKALLKAFGMQLFDDRRLDWVSLYSAGPTATFWSWTQKSGKKITTISNDICSTRSKSIMGNSRRSIGY